MFRQLVLTVGGLRQDGQRGAPGGRAAALCGGPMLFFFFFSLGHFFSFPVVGDLDLDLKPWILLNHQTTNPNQLGGHLLLVEVRRVRFEPAL